MSYIGKIPANAVLTTADLADGIVTAAKIEDGTVVAAEIASNAITTAKINADAVTGAKIADDAINSEHYTDGSIDTAHIADVNVTQGKIADQAINEAKMQISNAPSNGYMLTAQSGNTGGLTWAEAGGGKIAQVISTNNTTTNTFGSTTFGDVTGQTVNITPSATNSKILIFNHISVSLNNNHYVQFKLLRDSTSIGAGSNDSNRIGCITSIEGTGTDHMRTVAFQVLDSPSTTNQITYKAQVRTHDSNTVAFNRSLNDANQGYAPRASSEITVMEILA